VIKVVKRRKEEFDNLMASGNTQLKEGELDKAKNSFTEASKIYPKNNITKSKLLEVNAKIATEGKQNERAPTHGRLHPGPQQHPQQQQRT
jgi:outer membrane protein assembly factor BamD (BamD/ComL family)